MILVNSKIIWQTWESHKLSPTLNSLTQLVKSQNRIMIIICLTVKIEELLLKKISHKNI